jgi:hypothetical protein
MTQTKVLPIRAGADLVRSVFMYVRTWKAGPKTIYLDGGAMVGAVDGSDTIYLPSSRYIDMNNVGVVDGVDVAMVDHNWYAIWLIKNPTGDTHGLASRSFDNPTMPVGYENALKRRIGAVYYDASVTGVMDYVQIGKRITFNSSHGVASGGGGHNSWSLIDDVPPTVEVGHFQCYGPFNSADVYIGFNSASNIFIATSNGAHSHDRQYSSGAASIILLEQRVWTYSGGSSWTIYLSGYDDRLY